MQISDLYGPVKLDQQVKQFAENQLQSPANFSNANNSFANMVANPMLFEGGGGNVIDPRQAQSSAATSYLGERSNIASTDLQTKASFADLLANSGSNIGALMAAMTQLRTAQQGSSNSLLGGLGL